MELKEAIEIIRKKYPIAKDTEETEVLSQMAEIVKSKTNNFSKPDGISKDAIDMKSILQKLEIKPAEWRKSDRGFQRSEADSVIWLAEYLNGKRFSKKEEREEKEEEKQEEDLTNEEVELLELEAMALALELELYKYKKAKNKNKKKK